MHATSRVIALPSLLYAENLGLNSAGLSPRLNFGTLRAGA